MAKKRHRVNRNPKITAAKEITTEIKEFLEDEDIFTRALEIAKKHTRHLGLSDDEIDILSRECFHEALYY